MVRKVVSLLSILVVLLTACSAAPQSQVSYDPAALRFDGQRAYELENEFVTQFPNRDSGKPNNLRAAEWIKDRLTKDSWTCSLDQWEQVNYSRPVTYNNTVCRLPGQSEREIVVSAHHDQAPSTVQGADNDGSGIAILLHLSEIFTKEGPLPYTLVFLSSDAEEFGNLGTRRFLQTHPDHEAIIAAITLDNLGKYFYDRMDMEVTGQFHKVGALWLQLLAVESARAAGDLWVPKVRPVMDQVTSQAVVLNFMDQGPFVTAGIPALGFVGSYPAEFRDLHWQTYHTPEDVMQYQSADTLYQSGRIAEALVRQLLSMESFPSESGPYLYFAGSQQVLRGAPLYALLLGLIALFFAGSYFTGGGRLKEKLAGWPKVLPHFLTLWFALAAAVVVLYGLVAMRLMDEYAVYPATTKAPETLNPRWPAVIIFVICLIAFQFVGRWVLRRLGAAPKAGPMAQVAAQMAAQVAAQVAPPYVVKSFALFIVGLAGLYVLMRNPFSLLFFVPLLFWLLIGVRKGAGRILDIVLFLLGGLVVYFLFYFFGFIIQRMNFAVLWYILMMFSIQEITFRSALGITAVMAAGLVMIVNPPQKRARQTAEAASPVEA